MSTALSTLVTRMNVYTPVYAMDEVRKVTAIDQAIRSTRAKFNFPWTMRKSTLRVFQNVDLYPVASDHWELAILDDSKTDITFGDRPRYVFTSYKDFIEDPDGRNRICEVWDLGTRFLGVKNKTSANMSSSLLDNAETLANWAASGDAGTPVADTVVFKTGNGSIRVPITNSSNTATITDTFSTSLTDTNYKRKYFFAWIYLDSAPTSIELRLRTDASNYLSKSGITTQFNGQAFVADDWNLVSFDLNAATVTGTVSGTFASAVYILTGAATGTYYFDSSFVRGWVLEDYIYYSTYNTSNAAGTTFADFFAPDGATYAVTDVMLGDTVWHDLIVYEACTYLLADQKEDNILSRVSQKRDEALVNMLGRFPDLAPRITTNYYRFQTDFAAEMYPDLDIARG